MNIKRNINFFPDKEKSEFSGYKPDGKLRMRIRYGKRVINFNVGYRVEIEKWIKDAQRCKSGTSHGSKKISASEINHEIQRLESLSDDVFKSFEVKDQIPTVKEYRDIFNSLNGKKSGSSTASDTTNFFVSYDEFVSTMGKQNQWTNATITKFNSLRKHLISYNQNLSIKDLSEQDLQGFVTYLGEYNVGNTSKIKEKKRLLQPESQQLGMRNTTIAKVVSFIRWFLRWAASRGYYDGKLHETWHPKFKGTDGNQKEVIHLTWDELMLVYNFKFPSNKQYLERVRDVFCFLCFTSLRYSDVAKLKRSDIKGTYISVVTQKTVDGLRIELNNYSSAILEKYKHFHFPSDLALPVISNPKMNEYLKEMGKLVGIHDPQRIVYFKGNTRIEEVYPKYDLLTTHCGRRTFIVNALFLGIPAEVVMRWTGHSDYSAMKPYIKIVDALKEKEMNKFNI